MNQLDKKNIINLSEHPLFEKNEVDCPGEKKRFCRDKSTDFMETLFRFLGQKRATLISFIRLKLDHRKRLLFEREMCACENVQDEIRSVRKYFGHLKTNDAMALMISLPELLPGKLEALTYHGEASPEQRLMKFGVSFSISHEEATVLMLMLLLTREATGQENEYSAAKV